MDCVSYLSVYVLVCVFSLFLDRAAVCLVKIKRPVF
jgi:hypothetical protein